MEERRELLLVVEENVLCVLLGEIGTKVGDHLACQVIEKVRLFVIGDVVVINERPNQVIL
jgi:hypothetical protein